MNTRTKIVIIAVVLIIVGFMLYYPKQHELNKKRLFN